LRQKICKRCGRCCRITPPSLLEEDITLFTENELDYGYVYTIRAGEVVWDNLEDSLITSPFELLKFKESEEGYCVFYNHEEKSCSIYDIRPLQCRAFFCMDPSEFRKVFEKPKLTRYHLFKDSSIIRLIEEHEKKCNHDLLDKMIKQIEQDGEDAVKKVLSILRYDYELRLAVKTKLNIPEEYMDLIFGRPLSKTIEYYGLKLHKEGDTFTLTLSVDSPKAPV